MRLRLDACNKKIFTCITYIILCILSHPQILAVNGTSLLNLPYDESLRLLQNTDKTVELIVSQIFNRHPSIDNKWLSSTHLSIAQHGMYMTTSPVTDNNSSRSNKNVSQYAENITQSNKTYSNDGPIRSDDYFQHIRYDTSETSHRQEEKFIMRNGCGKIARDFSNSMLNKIDDGHLVSAKSMPDLPKVSTFWPESIAPSLD